MNGTCDNIESRGGLAFFPKPWVSHQHDVGPSDDVTASQQFGNQFGTNPSRIAQSHGYGWLFGRLHQPVSFSYGNFFWTGNLSWAEGITFEHDLALRNLKFYATEVQSATAKWIATLVIA
jgi:hypothetical protein